MSLSGYRAYSRLKLISCFIKTIFLHVIGYYQPNLNTNRTVYVLCLRLDNWIEQLTCHADVSKQFSSYARSVDFFCIIKSGAKLLNTDWIRQNAFFLKSLDADWVFLLLVATSYWLQFNWMKPCDVGNCTFRIKCSLNLLVSYICFDISSSIERAKSCRHCAQMQFPQKFFPLCDKQVIASALGPMGSEIQNI